jgi:hypothetical protein
MHTPVRLLMLDCLPDLTHVEIDQIGAARTTRLCLDAGIPPRAQMRRLRSSIGNPPRPCDTSAFPQRSISSTHLSPRAAKPTPFANSVTLFKARSGVARSYITIVHSKQLPDRVDLWERRAALYTLPAPPPFSARLGHVATNGSIMAATVEVLRVDNPEANETQAGSSLYRSSTMRCARACMSALECGARTKQERWSRPSRRVRRVCIVCHWKMCTAGGESRDNSAEAVRKKRIAWS